MKLYIAGPMSGHPDNNFQAFDDAAAAVRAAGHEVVSPADLNRAAGLAPSHVPTPEQYSALMRDDVRALLECDGIVLLPGWESSKGATFERQVAVMTGRRVLMLEDCGGGQ